MTAQQPTAAIWPSSSQIDVPYDSLPDKTRVWNGEPGSREEGLGRLALLTPHVVADAAKNCIKTGVRASLSWSMMKLDYANFGRKQVQHLITRTPSLAAYDDLYVFNPQQSSQWDGLRHYAAPFATGDGQTQFLFYGGTTDAEIIDRANDRIGIQHWAQQGICGRGVLLDYAAYAEQKGISYHAFSKHVITLDVLKDIAKQEGVTFRRGDILLVRSGTVKHWDDHMTTEAKMSYSLEKAPSFIGVEGSEDMVRWVWDQGFAAVAGDAVAFEVWPGETSYSRQDGTQVPGVSLHERLLAGMGIPIGELFDLEQLSRICREMGRWDFFLTSSPLNMPGGVSSPCNCLAIF
ncbi:hypothetical protein CDD82_7816 [Ophiocordyceps australis]|uniref:Cyclase n=1 Tax=Ophiocordyceps australis TaxID=1399860 RepID=A0A2C5YQP7_9HYPO|nr:hypothetical protein CDD82_7816 [Ophiocordyceps australis]